MKLYRNVTKTLLAVKTPRRLYVEPGMVIDVDALGDIARTDIAMFIDRGVLVSVEKIKKGKAATTPNARPVATKGEKPTTEVAVSENKTVVVHSIVSEEADQEPHTEMGRVTKSSSVAAMISAPPDTPLTMNPVQAPPVKGAAYDALPQDVKDKIADVEAQVASGSETKPPVKKVSRKAKK